MTKEDIDKSNEEGRKVDEGFLRFFKREEKRLEKAKLFLKKYNLENPDEIRNAAIRYVLNNPNVHAVCIGFRNFKDVEEHIKLSGSRLTPVDQAKLKAYADGCGSFYCRHACGECESDCPHNVPVNTIMRYNHYFTAQGREKYAMEKYAKLTTVRADRCGNCAGYCEAACSYNVPIQGLLALAHQNLTLV